MLVKFHPKNYTNEELFQKNNNYADDNQCFINTFPVFVQD